MDICMVSENKTVHLEPLSSKDCFCGYLHLQDIASYEAIAARKISKLYEKVWREWLAGVIAEILQYPGPC